MNKQIRNCLILGSGRSGTSMIAGTLASAGYFMGDDLYPARESNPKGFFEDPVINGINEEILEQLKFECTHPNSGYFENYPLTYGQRWLARVPVSTRIPSPGSAIEKIREVTRRVPFCFKDPRFSYTLPVWRPYLKNTVFLCIFRDPAATAASIIKECKDMEYLQSVVIDFNIAIEVWTLMYRHILETHRHEGEWLFVHYNQVLSGEILDKLNIFTGATVDRSFPEKSLLRSVSNSQIPESTRLIYQELCNIAGYRESSSQIQG
jgi:hypothetical protein